MKDVGKTKNTATAAIRVLEGIAYAATPTANAVSALAATTANRSIIPVKSLCLNHSTTPYKKAEL